MPKRAGSFVHLVGVINIGDQRSSPKQADECDDYSLPAPQTSDDDTVSGCYQDSAPEVLSGLFGEKAELGIDMPESTDQLNVCIKVMEIHTAPPAEAPKPDRPSVLTKRARKKLPSYPADLAVLDQVGDEPVSDEVAVQQARMPVRLAMQALLRVGSGSRSPKIASFSRELLLQ